MDDTKWIDDFQTQQADDELARTAKEFLSNVNDPQLTNSEVEHTVYIFLFHIYIILTFCILEQYRDSSRNCQRSEMGCVQCHSSIQGSFFFNQKILTFLYPATQ